tara:strand:+ start:1479 stop:1811 length:333 start_codon:yes stop_codon:yes gene_type:complete
MEGQRAGAVSCLHHRLRPVPASSSPENRASFPLTLRDSPQARDRLLIEGLPIEGGVAAIDRGTDGQVLWDPKRQTYPTIGDVVPVRQICDFSAVHQVIDALQQKCKTLCF